MTTGPPPVEPLPARAAACRAVCDALRGESFASDTLRISRAVGTLAGRELALATEIAVGTVRHLVTIEHVLGAVARYVPARLAPELRAVLCTAAYQIIWLDRVPVFAAVDQAVALARAGVGGRSPGMVNAVLRKLCGALADRRVPWQRLNPCQTRVSWDEACAFRDAVLPLPRADDRHAAHLAAATGERPGRYQTLVARYGAERAEQIAWAAQAVPVLVLQRNPLRIDAREFTRRLRAEAGDAVEFLDDAAFLPPAAHLPELPVFAEGLAFVQDPTAHAAALLVAARPGQRVLDLCAAPGGKSVALAMQMEDRGEVVACDVAPERLARVRENVQRLGLTCVRLMTLPPPGATPATAAAGGETAAEVTLPAAPPPTDLGLFDAVLLDVPCLNTGVIARRPEARLRLTARKLRALSGVQRDLLRAAARHVRPGGRLVYSTCSLEPEENEEQITRFLADHPDWILEERQATLPRWGPRLCDWRDGGFAARLRYGRVSSSTSAAVSRYTNSE